jgi:DNA polymerase III epsilon subunit-like protein
VSDLVFMGLDIESTRSDRPPKGQLIQIGIAMLDGFEFGMDVGYDKGEFSFDPEARKVNGFTDERVEKAPRPVVVDNQLTGWLQARDVAPKRGVAIGWNVGAFDLPFVHYYLPTAATRLSYRSIDLNAVCMTWAEANTIDWQTVKHAAKAHAEYRLKTEGKRPQWHDATYDAWAALYSWLYLQGLMAGTTGSESRPAVSLSSPPR